MLHDGGEVVVNVRVDGVGVGVVSCYMRQLKQCCILKYI